jgi:hypothetical protein
LFFIVDDLRYYASAFLEILRKMIGDVGHEAGILTRDMLPRDVTVRGMADTFVSFAVAQEETGGVLGFKFPFQSDVSWDMNSMVLA